MADEAQEQAREYIDRIVETQKRVGRKRRVPKKTYDTAVQRAGAAFKALMAISESGRREKEPPADELRRGSR